MSAFLWRERRRKFNFVAGQIPSDGQMRCLTIWINAYGHHIGQFQIQPIVVILERIIYFVQKQQPYRQEYPVWTPNLGREGHLEWKAGCWASPIPKLENKLNFSKIAENRGPWIGDFWYSLMTKRFLFKLWTASGIHIQALLAWKSHLLIQLLWISFLAGDLRVSIKTTYGTDVTLINFPTDTGTKSPSQCLQWFGGFFQKIRYRFSTTTALQIMAISTVGREWPVWERLPVTFISKKN